MPRFPNISEHAHSVSPRVYSQLAQRARAKNAEVYPLHVGDTYRDPLRKPDPGGLPPADPRARAACDPACNEKRRRDEEPVADQVEILGKGLRTIPQKEPEGSGDHRCQKNANDCPAVFGVHEPGRLPEGGEEFAE